jgi:diketogulonate reductase-like aldo/keto reductase
MAYSPIEQGAMLRRPELGRIAGRHGATAAQVALAWLLRGDDVSVIVKAADAAHLRDDRGALDLALTDRDLAEIDRAFPPPRKRVPLEMN